jgi:dsDNA-specific endonuclease/ATPase MutS2
LRADSTELQQARADLTEARDQAKTQDAEITGLRKDKEELLRLRSEVGKLSKQVQVAQSQAERAQAQAAQAVQSGSQQMQQLQSENQQLRTVAVQGQQVVQQNACINNLRQLDAAKQQWALEHNKTAETIPSAHDLAPYLKDGVLPICPSGGAYALNAVNQVPTCSIQGHAISR